jgi:hypothetical protein
MGSVPQQTYPVLVILPMGSVPQQTYRVIVATSHISCLTERLRLYRHKGAPFIRFCPSPSGWLRGDYILDATRPLTMFRNLNMLSMNVYNDMTNTVV